MVNMKTFGTLAAFHALIHVTTAYDIGCIFPRQWNDNPFLAIAGMSSFFTGFMRENQVETPVVVRTAHHSTLCRGMCLSFSDPDVLDPIDMTPQFMTVPEFGRNAYSVLLCIPQCVLHVMDGLFDFTDQSRNKFLEEYGVETNNPNSRSDIVNAYAEMEVFGNSQPLMDIIEAEDYHPITMGSVAGIKIRAYADQDGWNSEAAMTYDREIGMEVPCTGSCRYYQNTVGYEPVPDPRVHTYLSEDTEKYECTGLCRKWQPLQEGDDAGSLKRQEFTMPHIGQKAHTYVRDVEIMLEDPEYDLLEESLLVIERLKEASSDQYKQDAIYRFDNKLTVRSIISEGIRQKFGMTRIHSFQDEILFKVGLSTAEYDGVVQAWAEKAHHDLVRPTTVIKSWGNDDLYTYGGDQSVMGPVDIKARDFEAYIRVMPHSEFPSGSSCLCTTYYEFADTFMMARYNDTLTELGWGVGENSYVLANMEELRDVCGESRLWGGMHYTAAIDAGSEACSGIGQLAYDYVDTLKNGATFSDGGGPWYWGDDLPDCPNDPTMPPVEGCVDSELKNSFNGLGCSFLTLNPENIVHCDLPGASSHCPLSCGACDEYACKDSEVAFLAGGDEYSCSAFLDLDADETAYFCGLQGVASTCRESCGFCMM